MADYRHFLVAGLMLALGTFVVLLPAIAMLAHATAVIGPTA